MKKSLPKQKISITEWDLADRPREKLLDKGRQTLTNAELIAILIGSGNREETAVELSKKILKSANNSLIELGQMTLDRLMEFKGVGTAKAVSIAAALELGRRRKTEEVPVLYAIKSSKDAYEQLTPLFEDLPHEEFWVMGLSRSNKVLFKKQISKGGVSGTIADIKLIFKPAIEKLASALIIAHNHPSGQLKPSASDLRLTDKLVETGKIMDIPILDHLVIANQTYYSFADEGLI
ncbi:MAG: DNA repair protein RadC [Flavobacteriales bacterium]|jgi:DNA repair protein RadC|nr:DNA repair protein RadC [Flavobacteriales bacterium]